MLFRDKQACPELSVSGFGLKIGPFLAEILDSWSTSKRGLSKKLKDTGKIRTINVDSEC